MEKNWITKEIKIYKEVDKVPERFKNLVDKYNSFIKELKNNLRRQKIKFEDAENYLTENKKDIIINLSQAYYFLHKTNNTIRMIILNEDDANKFIYYPLIDENKVYIEGLESLVNGNLEKLKTTLPL